MSGPQTVENHTHIQNEEIAALLRKAAPAVPATLTPVDDAAAMAAIRNEQIARAITNNDKATNLSRNAAHVLAARCLTVGAGGEGCVPNKQLVKLLRYRFLP